MKGELRHCYETIRIHSKSFSQASKLLPRRVRDRAVVVYAWCRRADDAIDLVKPEAHAAALAALRAELDDIYAGRSLADPGLVPFQRVVHDCGVPRSYPAELLAGLEMDVDGRRYETMEPLLQYCYRVAGTVGLMMCHVMGVRDERAMRNAAHMGMAMQLTNICRDVAEDWARGRLYIPASVLERFDCRDLADRVGETLSDEIRQPLARATSHLLDIADRYYVSGDDGLRALSWRCALAVRTARLVYSSIGRRIWRAGCDPLAGRAYVGLGAKLGLTLQAAVVSAAELPGRLLRLEIGGAAVPERLVSFPDDVLRIS